VHFAQVGFSNEKGHLSKRFMAYSKREAQPGQRSLDLEWCALQYILIIALTVFFSLSILDLPNGLHSS
jgi:hypothetical protein